MCQEKTVRRLHYHFNTLLIHPSAFFVLGLREEVRRHWLVISAVVMHLCMFHMDYIIWEYLFSIWIGSFESRHFTLYRYVLSVRQVAYTQSFVLKFTDRDGRKHIMFAFIILQKCNVLLLLWVHTNKRRVFTDSKNVLLSSVWPKMLEYFRSTWAHRRLHLSRSERYGSASTLDWAAM